MNLCMFGGRLTADISLKDTQNSCVANFTVAINKSYKKSDGTWGQKVSFADCVIWAEAAKNLSQRFKKGDVIYFEASLETESWKDSEGKNKSRNKFRVNNFSKPIGFKSEKAQEVESQTTENQPEEQQIAF